MISTLGVIIIAVGASVCVFVGGAVSIILVLRAKDRQRRSKEEVARQFSATQRGRLSVGSSNYSHVPEPRANLRRSTHLRYGVVSEGWAAIPSQESLARYQKTLVNNQPGAAGTLTQQKCRRSLRASFSGHSFSLPKTRRQNEIDKAVLLHAMPRSPLSAIAERSGTNTSEASPAVGIAELPTEITPKTTPDKDGNALSIGRPLSLQWPLTTANRMSYSGAATIIPVPASRNSTLMRMNSTDNTISPIRRSLGQRSISMTSTLSVAPEDPLPPLPSIPPNQWPLGRKPRLSLSAASVDTIGSSVLGGGQRSPSQTDANLTSIGLGTPPIYLNSIGLQAYERQSQGWEPATVITTGSPKARHATKYRSGKAGYGSFRASIGNHSNLPNTTNERFAESRDRCSFIPLPSGPAPSTRDPRHRGSHLSSRANPVRSHVSPSPPVAIARTGSGYKRGAVTARHSMYEQDTGMGRFPIDPAVLHDVPGNPASPVRRPASSRPASIAGENPFHRDRNSLQTGLSSSLRSSPGSQRKCHKRQNCVRISNIPEVDTSRRASKLPQMTEEEEDSTDALTGKTVTIPGLSLLEQEKPSSDTDAAQEHVENSAFLSRQILESTSWTRPNYSRAPSSESMVSCKRDSDVFSNSRYDPSAPNIFTANSTPQGQWPLTPTARYGGKLQPTPPSLRAIQEPCDPDSPTLPMPAISSATLFARALPLGTRVSGVQGPRNIPTSIRSSRAASPSPMTARAAAKREDLRRSVMTLRRMNSDTKDTTRISQIYQDICGESTSNLLEGSNRGGHGPAAKSAVSGVIVPIGSSSPNSQSTNLQIPPTNNQHVSAFPSTSSTFATSGLRFSKSRSKIAPSPSTMSADATSIWEDISVRGESPEPELPTSSSRLSSPQSQLVDVDIEAHENFIGQDVDKVKGTRKDRDRDRIRESRLTSPQGKGLGLMGVQVQGKVWGTPGSLYDGDGFLME